MSITSIIISKSKSIDNSRDELKECRDVREKYLSGYENAAGN